LTLSFYLSSLRGIVRDFGRIDAGVGAKKCARCLRETQDRFFAAVRDGKTEDVRKAFRKRASLDARNDHVDSALSFAAYYGQPETARILIQAGAVE